MSRHHSHSATNLTNIVYSRDWVKLVKTTIGKSTFTHKELPPKIKSISFLKRAANDGYIRSLGKGKQSKIKTWKITID